MNDELPRPPPFPAVTAAPTASTVPAPSWPRMAGGGKGRVPSTSDTSEWQTPEAPMRRTTSRGPGGSGSASSTEMGASTPTNTAAFMDLASWSGVGADGVAQGAGEDVVVVVCSPVGAEGDPAPV